MALRLLVWLTAVLEAALLVLPPGSKVLDTRPYYGAAEALAYLDALGPDGRRAYFVHECVDLVFIASYTTLLHLLARRWGAPRWLSFVPAVGDLVETVGILLLTSVAATTTPGFRGIASVIGFATLAKWVGFVAVIVVHVRAVIVRWRATAPR